jgi:aspartyl/asparaginyl-tRNA synthetase
MLPQILESFILQKNLRHIDAAYGLNMVGPSLSFPRIVVIDAIKICQEQGYKLPPDNKSGMDPQGERIISQYVKKKFDHELVFLTKWPVAARPFHHKHMEKPPGLTLSFDLIGNGLEIATGAQREHRPKYLVNQALEKGLNIEPIQFNIDFFRFGCPPHGEFGFGLARLMMIMLKLPNLGKQSIFSAAQPGFHCECEYYVKQFSW